MSVNERNGPLEWTEPYYIRLYKLELVFLKCLVMFPRRLLRLHLQCSVQEFIAKISPVTNTTCILALVPVTWDYTLLNSPNCITWLLGLLTTRGNQGYETATYSCSCPLHRCNRSNHSSAKPYQGYILASKLHSKNIPGWSCDTAFELSLVVWPLMSSGWLYFGYEIIPK